MSLISCRLCSHQCAKEAKKCPNCGGKTPHRETYKMWTLLEFIAGGLGLGYGIYAAFYRDFLQYESETFKTALIATMIITSVGWMIKSAAKLLKD